MLAYANVIGCVWVVKLSIEYPCSLTHAYACLQCIFLLSLCETVYELILYIVVFKFIPGEQGSKIYYIQLAEFRVCYASLSFS